MKKVVIAQIDTLAGDIKNNSAKIIENIKKAQNIGADVIIFPELTLCGSPLGNIIVRHKAVIKQQSEALRNIAEISNNIAVILGCVGENADSIIAFIKNKKIDYINDFKIINDTAFVLDLENLKNVSCQNVVLLANTPSRYGFENKLNEQLSKIKANLVYVNRAGYADNVVFSGASRVYINGSLTARAKYLEEDFLIIDDFKGEIEPLPAGVEAKMSEKFDLDYSSDLERVYKSSIFAIKEYFRKNGFSKAVLGLSGGLDSTISAVLLTDALGRKNVVGISMPSRITSDESKNDAKELSQNLGITFFEIPLASSIDVSKLLLNKAFEKISMEKYAESTTMENLQARTRATILWSVSNEYKGMLPIATSDKSEAYIGYATVNGDMSGGFAPIADITKTKLFALGKFINELKGREVVPKSVLEKPPGAELKINQKTGRPLCAEEANMPYEFLDEIVWMIENFGYGKQDLYKHSFLYEKNHELSQEQKEEWINKFYWKMHCATYKWHIMPASVIQDAHSINSVEYYQPILSNIL
ncbi:NAD(+) synthase [bacterium]|nr:NAD(+) synthase [bacterium]